MARGVYLLVAIGCMAAVAGGLLWVLLLQASTTGKPAQVAVPPPWQDTTPPPQLPPRELDLGMVGARLSPPAGIRFEVSVGPLSAPPRAGMTLGQFRADSPNRLAGWPDGVSISGGPDAELFDRVRVANGAGVGLAARPALVEQLGTALSQGVAGSRDFTIRVVVRDRFGQRSAPADVTFNLRYGPAPSVAAAPTPVPTRLEQLARAIARHLEPEVNPAHFKAYERALATPDRCGAGRDDPVFLDNYRRAYDFPLYPGKTWQRTTTETNRDTGAVRIHTITGRVENWESVTVPAGTFHGLRVVLETALLDQTTGERVVGSDTSWSVPAVRRSVQSITTGNGGSRRALQLLRYSLAPGD